MQLIAHSFITLCFKNANLSWQKSCYKKFNIFGAIYETTQGCIITTIYGLIFSLLACGGESGFIPAANNSPQAIITHQGLFIDSAVEGLTYASPTHKGRTTESGMFRYSDDTTIAFSVGDIILGQAKGAPIVPPIDFVPGANATHPTVTNIARFLQTIDDDATPQNGITITSIVADEAKRQSINFAQSIDRV